MTYEYDLGTFLYPRGIELYPNYPRFHLENIEEGDLEDLLGMVDEFFWCSDPLVVGRRFFALEEPSLDLIDLANSKGLTASYGRYEWSPTSELGWELELRAKVEKPLSESVRRVLATIEEVEAKI